MKSNRELNNITSRVRSIACHVATKNEIDTVALICLEKKVTFTSIQKVTPRLGDPKWVLHFNWNIKMESIVCDTEEEALKAQKQHEKKYATTKLAWESLQVDFAIVDAINLLTYEKNKTIDRLNTEASKLRAAEAKRELSRI